MDVCKDQRLVCVCGGGMGGGAKALLPPLRMYVKKNLGFSDLFAMYVCIYKKKIQK